MSHSNLRKTRKGSALLLSTILASGLAAPAYAQDTPEPYRHTDEHGVDLATGTFNFDIPEGSIGPADGGVAMVRYLGRSGYGDNWSGDLRKVSESGQIYIIITFGNISEKFKQVGAGWITEKANGATLVENVNLGIFDYNSPDGTAITFQDPKMLAFAGPNDSIEMPSNFCKTSNALACGIPTKIKTPKQVQYDLYWTAARQCPGGGPPPEGGNPGDPGSPICTVTYRLGDVRSNSGYAMKIKYQSNSPSAGNGSLPPTGWWNRSTLKFLDLSQTYCASLANNCDNVSGSWPTVTYTYPSTGVLDIVNSENGTWRLDRSSAAQLKIRRPGQSIDNIIVNFSGGKVSSITADGETKSYIWGISGGSPAVSTTDGAGSIGSVTTMPYTGSYRPATLVNGAGQTTSYTYDIAGRVTRETRPEGDYTSYTYDARGNVTETRAVAKAGSGLADIVTSASFDAVCSNPAKCNKPNYTIDARGNRTDYSYDATTGELTRVQLPAASSGGIRPEVNYVYSSLSAQARNASNILVSQPAQAKLTQITACANAATCAGAANETKITIAYNTPNLLPTSVTRAAGDGSISSTVAYAYDARDNLTAIDGPLPGNADSVTYVYDAFNRRRGVIGVDPDGGGARLRMAERYSFDAQSRVVKVETGTVTGASEAALNAMTVAQTVDIIFDANGNKVKETVSGSAGVVHQVVQLGYDAAGRLQCTAQRMNSALFASLPASACTMGTAGTGANDFGPDRITKNSYDAAGRITKVQTAFGAAEQADEASMGYTNNGQVAYVVDAEANRTAYVYDGHDRLSQTRYPLAAKGSNAANASDYEQLDYDANGNVTARRLRDGTSIAYAYDNLDRPTLIDAPGGVDDISHGYDLLGRLTSVCNNDSGGSCASGGWNVTRSFDALSRLASEAAGVGAGAKTLGYQYDAAGRRTRLTHSDGFYVSYDHDVTGNVTHIRENGAASGVGVLATYAYDNLGRRVSVTFGNGVVQSYAFDTAQWLQTLTSNMSGTSHDQTATLAYNPAGQIDSLSKSNDAYAWSGHYNRDTVYGSNGLNQLMAATPGSGQTSVPALTHDARGNTTGIGSATYAYDIFDRMASGTVGGATTWFNYDGLGRMRSISPPSDVRQFYYDGEALALEYNYHAQTVARRYVHGPGVDEPIVAYEGSGTTNRRFLTADERGSITAVTDSSGSVIATNSYDEYGNPGASNATIAQGGRFGYTGQTWLPELNLWHYKARIYNPALGRFMQTDPIGYADGMNWHNYVGGDPVNFVDPTGLDACMIDGEPAICVTGGLGEGRGSGGSPIVVTPPRIAVAPPESTELEDPQFNICQGRALVYAGNPRHVGRTGGMLRPIRSGAAAIIPRQWTGTRTPGPLLRSQGRLVGGVTRGGQRFSGLDDTAGNTDLGPDPQGVLLGRANGALYIELVTGRHEGFTTVTLAIPIGNDLPCPAGTTHVGTR